MRGAVNHDIAVSRGCARYRRRPHRRGRRFVSAARAGPVERAEGAPADRDRGRDLAAPPQRSRGGEGAHQPARRRSGRDPRRARSVHPKCETCHAYDGGGKTEIGTGTFRARRCCDVACSSMSDGEIFYHIRNGIRNTAMPAWNFPDRQVWQLVSYLRHLPTWRHCRAAGCLGASRPPSAHYVGSKACQSCHQEIYARWQQDRDGQCGARSPSHPDAIIPDLSKPDPLVNFSKDDVAFVYGSKWKQRYFKKIGDTYFPLPVQWNIAHQEMAELSRAERRRLVGGALSRPTIPPPHRAALRRLPFGELQHRHQNGQPNGMSAASSAMAPAATMSPVPRGSTSSIRRGRISCRPTTPASSATPRASR